MARQASGCWDTVVSKTDLFLLSKSLRFDGDVGGGLEIIIMQAGGKLQTMMRARKESSREF